MYDLLKKIIKFIGKNFYCLENNMVKYNNFIPLK